MSTNQLNVPNFYVVPLCWPDLNWIPAYGFFLSSLSEKDMDLFTTTLLIWMLCNTIGYFSVLSSIVLFVSERM